MITECGTEGANLSLVRMVTAVIFFEHINCRIKKLTRAIQKDSSMFSSICFKT